MTNGTLNFGDDYYRQCYRAGRLCGGSGGGEYFLPFWQGIEAGKFPSDLELIGDDIDEDNESLTITATDLLLGSASARFTIRDDDTARVAVSLEDQNVRKGDQRLYEVVLKSQPIANVEVVVTVVEGRLNSEAQPGNVTVAAVEGILPLTFTPINWSTPRALLLTVAPNLDAFGELEIRHTINSEDDPTYAALDPVSAVLELTDVNVDLKTLEVTRADGGPIVLRNAADDPIDFSPSTLEYFATVPFSAEEVLITATPAVAVDIFVGDPPQVAQRPAKVRIFLAGAEDQADENVAGVPTSVELQPGEDVFTISIVVSESQINGLGVDEELAMQPYSLILRRELPEDARLQVYLDSATGREEILEPLDFDPDDDEMTLILTLHSDVNNASYEIEEIEIMPSPLGRLEAQVDGRRELDGGDFGTQVTLSRVPDVESDTEYEVIFMATPERPRAANTSPLSAEIEGTLKANANTRTEIQATYLGEP